MLLILAIVYFLNSNISASPVSYGLRDAIPPNLNSLSSQCECPAQQRSLWDILWSCLATMFACTWVSVHPNIPPSGEKWWKTGLRRLELMCWVLIAPELIILWAMRQWNGARAIVRKYHEHRWTKTHGYFMQMGGFTLFKGGEPVGVLLPAQMDRLLETGKIDLPHITEEEIRDRSKGDGLSKALVLGQTSWFIAQCIARRAQGLILTELELVTAAFAALNGAMYFLWWNKPLDAVAVHLLDQPKEPYKFQAPKLHAFSPRSAIFSLHHGPTKISFSLAIQYWNLMKNSSLQTVWKIVINIIVFPWTVIKSFLIRLANIITPEVVRNTTGSVSTVPTFYATLFGGLHCIAWFFTFPSYAELITWRVCSVIISTIPLGVLFFSVARFRYDHEEPNSRLKKIFGTLGALPAFLVVIAILVAMGLLIYAIARLLLLSEAFAALRYLPPDALAVVDWLSFLPHI